MTAPHDNERRATEDLLAGFDRPGRSPRAPVVKSAIDFNAQAGPVAETVLVTRRQQRALWPWLALAFLASAGIGTAGFAVATRANEAPPPEREKHAVATPIEAVVPASVVELAPPSAAASTAPTPHAPAASAKKPEHRDDFAHEL